MSFAVGLVSELWVEHRPSFSIYYNYFLSHNICERVRIEQPITSKNFDFGNFTSK